MKQTTVKRSVKILWRLFYGGFLAFGLLLVLANFGVFGKMPSLQELQNPEASLAAEIYSADGKFMGKYFEQDRSEVKYSDLSPNLVNALIATEDERFKEHSGIDGQALARAVVKLGKDGGGSTITQQLAKMILGQGSTNFLLRLPEKLKEWIIAVKLERNFTKEEIITLYLNRAAWGNIFGIRNASLTYFQKEPKDLTIEQAAVLVGMLKGFIYDPIRHPDKSLVRRNTVINQMMVCKDHFLTPAEATKLQAKPLLTNYKRKEENLGIAPYFRDELKDKIKEWCKTHKNPKTGENYNLFKDGMKIYTTIDSRMQKYAEEAVEAHMPNIQRKLNWNLKVFGSRMWKGHDNVITDQFKFSERWKTMKEDEIPEEEIKKTFYKPVRMKIFAWNAKHELDTLMTPYDSIKYHLQLIQTSFACTDAKSGEIKAWVGGIDYRWFKKDHVAQKRQVGSSFKPLLYTLAVTDMGYGPESTIEGGAITLSGKTIKGGGGTMAYCLSRSLNAAAYRLMSQIGVKRTKEFAKTCGIVTDIPNYPSIALGTGEIPLPEMLRAYSMFPNKGINIETIMLTRIEDKNGNLLQAFQAETKPVINEADAYTMVQIMEGVVQQGTAKSLNGYGIPVKKAGKTGTTNDNADGWFIGYTPELIAGSWVGCEYPFIQIYSGTSGGNEMALPNWGKFMNKIYNDKKLGYGKKKDFDKPAANALGPISGDILPGDWFKSDGNLTPEEINEGNGNANDYGDLNMGGDSSYNEYNDPTTEIKKDTQNIIAKPDTGKGKKPAVKPVTNPADKPKPAQQQTDYK